MDNTAPALTHLDRGSHKTREDGVCLMEAVAWLANENHTDHPECCSVVLAAFGRSWNDGLPDEDRDRLLLPLLDDLLGTGPLTEDQEHDLALECLDWYLREMTPAFLSLVPSLESRAKALRERPKITDENAVAFGTQSSPRND